MNLKPISESKNAVERSLTYTYLTGTSLSQQLSESTNSQILRLQLDNRRLKAELDAQKESELLGNVSLRLEIDKENTRLSRKVAT